MADPTSMRKDFENKMLSAGTPLTIKYWSGTNLPIYSGADYDEEYYPNVSGTVISGLGMVQPVGKTSSEVRYLEQGKLSTDDRVLFIHGSLYTDPNMRVSIAGDTYTIAEPGIVHWDVSGTTIYKQIYIHRQLGSYGVF